MNRNGRGLRLSTLAVAIWASWGMSFAQGGAPAVSNATLIGAINGAPIWYRFHSDDTIADMFFLQHKRAPDPGSDGEELNSIRQSTKCFALNNGISNVAMEAAKVRFAVSATEEELASARQAQLSKIDPEAEAAKVRAFNAPIVSALDEVYEAGASPDDVFRREKDQLRIPEEQWKIHVYFGRVPAYRARLRRAASVTADEAAKGLAEVRPAVEREKLGVAIDREIGMGDPVFLANARVVEEAKKQKPSSLTIPVYEQVKEGRARWWREFYSSMRVVIYDSKLEAACKVDPSLW